MTTYSDAGVDIAAGDSASKNAYTRAMSTFAGRTGRIGEPVQEEDGYAGFMDMGDYYLVMSDDSTGTKIDIAAEMNHYDTLGYDLLAMVADDVVCVGAEVIAVSNCIDVPKVDPVMIDTLMKGLAAACTEQKIIVPAGEIAEVPGAVNRGVWSATAVGIVEKNKVIHPERITAGDCIIGLQSGVARSNGFSLIRKILSDSFGSKWHSEPWKNNQSWGEVMLTPSVIYHDAVLSLTGRHQEERLIDIKGISHITGGGIPSKLRRILKKSGCGAELTDLWQPHEAVRDLIQLGKVATDEAYRTWNMGTGMMLVVSPNDAEKTLAALSQTSVHAKIVGTITADNTIRLQAFDGQTLTF